MKDTKPSIVFWHGIWADGSCFSKVIPALQAEGHPHSGMVFVESVMDKYDAPIDLIVGGHALADSDYGVPGPQSAANAQIPVPAGVN